MPEERELTVSYTVFAEARGRADEPDDAIADLIDEVDQPRWGVWSIFGEIVVGREDDGYWVARASMTRTVDVEI